MNTGTKVSSLYDPNWQGRKIVLMLVSILLCAAGAVMAQTPPQIGIKFGINGLSNLQSTNAGALQPTDLAGVFPQTNWNVVGRYGDSTGATSTNVVPFSVLDSSGASAGIVLNWDASGNYSQSGAGTPNAQATPDGNLMNGFLDSGGNANTILNTNTLFGLNASNKPLVYVSGLSTWMSSHSVTSYDVVIYGDGDQNQGRTGEYWLMNASGPTTALVYGSDITTHQFLCDRFNFVTDGTYRKMPPTISNGFVAQYGGFDGNYTVFQNVTNDSFLIRTEEFRNGGTLRSPINAVQIIPRTSPLPAVIDPLFPAIVYTGGRAVFRAAAAGVVPMTFQWQKGGVNVVDGGNISGSLTSTLIISNVTLANQGNYTVIVSNAMGTSSSSASLTVLTPTPGSFAEKLSTNKPLAYWRLNELGDPSTNFTAAIDYYGGFTGSYEFGAQNGFNGVVGPQPSAGYPGFESGNTALQANNSAHAWVAIPPLGLNTNTATFMAWVYPTTASEPGSAGIIFTRNTNSDIGGLDFHNDTGNHLGYTWNNNSATYGFTGPVVPANTWSLVAVTVSASNAVLYCYNTNSQISMTNNVTNAIAGFNGVTLIGDDAQTPTTAPSARGFVGAIDEAAVFNRVLSGTEINDLFKKGLGLTAISPIFGSQPLPVTIYGGIGRTATFSTSAFGDQPLTYQWRSNGVAIANGGNFSGVTNTTLVISNVDSTVAADYTVVVANLAGSLTSSVATLTVVAPPGSLSPYETKLQALGPVDYWRFNEAGGAPIAYDYWGGDMATNHNAQSGSSGPQPPDFPGFEANNSANSYDGFSAATDTGLNGLMNNLQQFTVMGWYNAPGIEPTRVGLFGQNDVVEFGFLATNGTGQAQLGIFGGNGGGTAQISQPLIPQNQWVFTAAVGNGTNVNLYLFYKGSDGSLQVLQSTAAGANTNYGSSVYPFNIGGDGVLDPGPTNYFAGLIDEVAVFKRALSTAELADLFGTAIGVSGIAPQITSQPAPATETLYSGRTVTYSVAALGSGTLTYRWRSNSVPLTDGGNIYGSGTPTLTISNVTTANANVNYDVLVSNTSGSTNSTSVSFTVIPLAPGGYAATVVGLNPVAYYRLNESEDPSSGAAVANEYVGGHNGVYAGAGTSNLFNGIHGPVPPQFAFETTNGAVEVSPIADSWVTAPFGSLSTNTVTMCMWINPQGPFNQYAGLLMNRNAGVAGGFGFAGTDTAGGQLGYTWNNNSASAYQFNSGIYPPTNQWSFVALVVQPTQAIIYSFNAAGIKSATNVLAHTSDVFGNNWQIGRDNSANANDGTRTFDGIIDEVAVFNYSLTPTQLLSLYTSGGGIGPVTLHIQNVGGKVVLTWPAGTLQEATSLSGPWNNNAATSPYTNNAPTDGTKFYRVKVQ